MNHLSIRRGVLAALVVPLALALGASGCASSTGVPAPTELPHGFVEGATEVQEPQLRLVTLDASGALAAFDPVAESSLSLAMASPSDALSTDGRFLFLADAATKSVQIVDSGAWTVPHGDHSHYYLAAPREIGQVTGSPAAIAAVTRVFSSASLAAIHFGASGTGVILDREALADGEIVELGRITGEPHDGALLPIGDGLVGSVGSGGAGEAVQVYSATGAMIAGATSKCTDLAGAASTRVGVVFGCADGALLATETADGSIGFERIPYPDGTKTTDRATSFSARPGRPAVAAVAGRNGAWLLDTRARSWTRLGSGAPLLAASAVGDSDGTVVGIDRAGRVVVLGDSETSRTGPLLAGDLVEGDLPTGITLELDTARAYVNSPAEGVVYEIDYADGARVSRTLDVSGNARAFVETGR